MEPRISLITLGVADLQRSLTFYRDGLGLPTTWDTAKGVVFFQTQGTCLALYPQENLSRDLGVPDPTIPAAAPAPVSRAHTITLAHNVRQREDVDAVMDRAMDAGATIIKPPADTFWGGYAGYFADPDGHLWEIAWGAFDFREDGSLQIP